MEVEQQEDCHADPEFPNTRLEQIPMTMETTAVNGLVGIRVMRTNAISLTSILDETVEIYHSINYYHMNLQSFESSLQRMVATLSL